MGYFVGTENVSADFGSLESQANEIKTCSVNMGAAFDNFINAMKEVGEDTEILFGVSSDSLIAQFDSLKGQFSNYTDRVDKLVEVINQTSSSTEETDSRLSAMTDELNDKATI